MKTYTINDNYISSANQRVFKTSKPFTNDCIEVYVNDALQVFGEDSNYLTLPSIGVIVFKAPIEEGSIVSIRNNITSSVDMEVVSYGNRDKPNALFKKYSSNLNYRYNNKYQVHVAIDDTNFEWKFLTKFNPMFSTVKKVLEDCGEFLQGFTEEYISSMIHRNSITVIDLINELANAEEPITNVTVTKSEDGSYTTDSKAVNNWVRIKTEMDLIYARYYGISYNYGSMQKDIGDISIQKDVKLPYIDELLKRLKKEFEVVDEAIRKDGYAFVGSAVKGRITYEYSERGSF